MSYDISLKDPVTKETIEFDFPHFMAGGTYAIGGIKEAWLNVTYNYSDWYYSTDVFPDDKDDNHKGINYIVDMTGAESIPILKNAIDKISKMKNTLTKEEIEKETKEFGGSYWVSTKENAIKPLHQLIAFAEMRPDGVWYIC